MAHSPFLTHCWSDVDGIPRSTHTFGVRWWLLLFGVIDGWWRPDGVYSLLYSDCMTVIVLHLLYVIVRVVILDFTIVVICCCSFIAGDEGLFVVIVVVFHTTTLLWRYRPLLRYGIVCDDSITNLAGRPICSIWPVIHYYCCWLIIIVVNCYLFNSCCWYFNFSIYSYVVGILRHLFITFILLYCVNCCWYWFRLLLCYSGKITIVTRLHLPIRWRTLRLHLTYWCYIVLNSLLLLFYGIRLQYSRWFVVMLHWRYLLLIQSITLLICWSQSVALITIVPGDGGPVFLFNLRCSILFVLLLTDLTSLRLLRYSIDVFDDPDLLLLTLVITLHLLTPLITLHLFGSHLYLLLLLCCSHTLPEIPIRVTFKHLIDDCHSVTYDCWRCYCCDHTVWYWLLHSLTLCWPYDLHCSDDIVTTTVTVLTYDYICLLLVIRLLLFIHSTLLLLLLVALISIRCSLPVIPTVSLIRSLVFTLFGGYSHLYRKTVHSSDPVDGNICWYCWHCWWALLLLHSPDPDLLLMIYSHLTVFYSCSPLLI